MTSMQLQNSMTRCHLSDAARAQVSPGHVTNLYSRDLYSRHVSLHDTALSFSLYGRVEIRDCLVPAERYFIDVRTRQKLRVKGINRSFGGFTSTQFS